MSSDDDLYSHAEKCVILIFARVPRVGKVKTRLVNQVLSPENAAFLYEGFLKDTINSALKLPGCDVILSLTDDPPIAGESLYEIPFFRDSVDINHHNLITQFHNQPLGTFGERMKDAIEWVRSQYSYDRIIILGADSPHIQPAILEQARNLLSYYEAVIGPSAVGGIYLIGLRDNVTTEDFENVFKQVELIQISHFLRKNDIKFFILEELTDIDTEDDLIGLISWLSSAKLAGNDDIYIPEETEWRLKELRLKITTDPQNNRHKKLMKFP
jgi:glycosyltransferase A (GT-A) superfamily protein (DUF2064 family)